MLAHQIFEGAYQIAGIVFTERLEHFLLMHPGFGNQRGDPRLTLGSTCHNGLPAVAIGVSARYQVFRFKTLHQL